MAAEVLYFRHDLWNIGRAWLRSVAGRELRPAELDARLGWYLILGTIPIGVLGLAFEDSIENGARNLTLIAVNLIVFGLVLLAADRLGPKVRAIASIRLKDGLLMGLAQSLALVPGVSRSGGTISAGLFLGLDRVAAARFSFLLSIPAVVLSGLYQLASFIADGGDSAGGADLGWGTLVVATLLAFVAGYATIAFLLRWLVSHTLGVFVAYRIALGAVVLALVGAGAIE